MQFSVNDFAAHVLKAIKNGEDFSFPCMYNDQLRDIDLDFSLDSLNHIDALLLNIRNRYKPSYDNLIQTQAGQLFLMVLAFYFMSVMAKVSQCSVKWFDYEEFKAIVPANAAPEHCFETNFVCIAQSAIRLPLFAVNDILFKNPAGLGLANYAEQFLNEPPEHIELNFQNEKETLSDELVSKNESLVNLSECMGLLLAATIAHAPSTNFGITLLAPSTEEGRPGMKLVKFMSDDTSEFRNHLDNNPRQKEWLCGVCDGYVYPYEGKTDALIFEAINYQKDPKTKIHLYLPYSHDETSKQFYFSKPLLINNHWSDTDIEIISKSIIKHILQMPIALDALRKYYPEYDTISETPIKKPWYKFW